jgi:hypothetical protein
MVWGKGAPIKEEWGKRKESRRVGSSSEFIILLPRAG